MLHEDFRRARDCVRCLSTSYYYVFQVMLRQLRSDLKQCMQFSSIFFFFRDFFSEFSLLRLGQYQSVSTFSSTMWYSATPAYTWPQSVLSRSRSSTLKVAYPLSTNASLQHPFEGESVAAATLCIHTRKRIDSVRLRHMACAA